ncbi:hypothetical protein [Enterobacter kobei]|uniref:hypothetical protein n=1 Tax=Enterobacter kobei TaxID=208224 RepID=UPI00388FBACD
MKQARIKAGFTQQEAAERFGFTLSAWQAKETSGKTSRGLAAGTYELLCSWLMNIQITSSLREKKSG